MEIKEFSIKGVYEISLNPHIDDRGFFMRTYDSAIFGKSGLQKEWVQENHSHSNSKGIIRGLHLQLPPFAETKLVRCIRGSVIDVFVDLRLGSETFGEWGKVELSAENKTMVYIPRGFAHGFCTMTERSEVLYKVDNFYSKDHELGIQWDDVNLKIAWPVKEPILSDKDRNNLSFDEFCAVYKGIEV